MEELPQLYLENQLCFPLYATSRLTTQIYYPFLQELGITYPQYLVMLALWQHDVQSVKSLGEQVFLESNTLTPLLKRLESKKFIKRERSQTDERTVLISLTPAGAALKYKAKEIPKKIIDSFQDNSITEKEVLDFQATLFKLLGILHKRTLQSEVLNSEFND
ncbi:MAG: MarR family transcriptional regulator [Bacteroidetes bacterium]|nr:MAG: MarR family transcriptional regulator [Bacteroidota bacterium]